MSRVESYAASNLRYVGEAKLARLSDADLVELHKLLKYKLGEVPTALPADKPATIKAILDLKVRIGIISKAEADAAVSETVVPLSGSTAQEPPREEPRDAQGTNGDDGTNDALAYAREEFEKMFAKETAEEGVDAEAQAAEDEANRARANAFVQLVAAASPPARNTSRSFFAPRAIVMPQSPSPATWSHAVSCASAASTASHTLASAATTRARDAASSAGATASAAGGTTQKHVRRDCLLLVFRF